MASSYDVLPQDGEATVFQEAINKHQHQLDEPEAEKTSGIWRIHWRSPTSMIGLFIGATGAAVAHHLYYDSVDGTEVVIVQEEWTLEAVRNSQEWKLRFGAGLAFLAKAMFAASAIVAYEQRAWLTARNKAVTVAGLDAMFSAAQSPLSFFSVDFLRKAKAGAIMALLVWCIPLAAVITPGTLVVIPTTVSTSKSFPVPVVNFSQVQPLYDFDSSVIGYDGQSTSNGITPYLSRLVSTTATSLQILPMNIGLANSTYDLTFHAGYVGRWPPSMGYFSASLRGYRGFICTRFFYSTSEQAQRIDPEYSFKWTEEDVHGSYFYLADALATLLGGAVRVLEKGIMAYKTRVTDTAIFGALKAESTNNASSGLLPKLLAQDLSALARNKTVGELIEELSRNITLSVFNLDQILAPNKTCNHRRIHNDTMVRISSDVNVYSYNRRVLIITYAVVFLGTLIALLIGGAAYFKNGVSHQLSFSAFMSTTRNYRLDELTAGSSMGAMPLRDSIKSTKLQFGFLRNADEEADREEAMRRVGFGLSDQIVPLQKGVPYC
ncbi:hypothetical protein Trihar35433_10647 [Trichoderma harzianum]|nr:hypothetical protein Trihar35433_10647 [Trichoderma harzianum]